MFVIPAKAGIQKMLAIDDLPQLIENLHGFFKKGQKLAMKDKNLAKQRLAKLRGAL